MERLGAHTMPAGLYADWNDCLRLGKKGESTFVAFQLYYAMSIIKGYALDRGDNEYAAYIDKVQPELGKRLEACWDEDRFIRGYRENGEIVGAKKDPEAFMGQCGSTHSLGQLSQASHLISRLKLLWKRYTRYSILHLA